MNRPYWVELFHVAGFFAPSTVVAAAGAFGLSNWLDLPGWTAVLVYVGSAILAMVSWVIGLVAWNRIVSPRAGEDLGANRDGNRHRQN